MIYVADLFISFVFILLILSPTTQFLKFFNCAQHFAYLVANS